MDTEDLLKVFQRNFDETGKKYQDALNMIDHMSNNPNVTSALFDSLHNELNDRDTAIARLHTELEAQKDSLERAHRDAGKSIKMFERQKTRDQRCD